MRALQSLLKDDRGTALAEYALVLALIALGSMMAMAGVALACSTTWTNSSNALQTYVNGTPPP